MRISAIVAAGLLASVATAALADDTTTTTTTTRTDPQPAPGVTVGVPGVLGVTVGGGVRPADGCATRTTTHTNDDTGDSVSRTSTNCD